jgi:hypothetical protein
MVPHDYFRFTRFGVARMFDAAGMRLERVDPSNGSLWTAVNALYHEGATEPLVRFGRRSLRGVALSVLWRVLVAPLRWFGRWTDGWFNQSFPIYFFVIAVKPDPTGDTSDAPDPLRSSGGR